MNNELLLKDIAEYSTQYTSSSQIELYGKLFKRHVFLLDVKGAIIKNETIFENEMFLIGGLKTLRGFDEQSIVASAYSILNLEYRYMLDKNSYLNLFWNGAYYENKNSGIVDRPYGFGAGISFETKAGIFTIAYALGKQFDNPIYFKQAKIHFGIVNFF